MIELIANKVRPDGQCLLEAWKTQSVEVMLALTPVNGLIRFDPASCQILLRSLTGDYPIVPWVFPEDIVENELLTDIEKVGMAGRDLRKKLTDHAIVGMPMTPRLWLTLYGDFYGITSLPYVGQMCRQQAVAVGGREGKQKPHIAKLPAPFYAAKIGDNWIIQA